MINKNAFDTFAIFYLCPITLFLSVYSIFYQETILLNKKVFPFFRKALSPYNMFPHTHLLQFLFVLIRRKCLTVYWYFLSLTECCFKYRYESLFLLRKQRAFSFPYFLVFGLNVKIYRITHKSKSRKRLARNFLYEHFLRNPYSNYVN